MPSPNFDAPKVATLQQNTAVKISAQQGLWYQLLMPAKATGFVRVNDVRLAYAGTEDGEANVRVLMGGKAGKGRVTETAGVRGIDESDLKSAAMNQAQLNAMVGHRVDASAAATYAAQQGWQATSVAYAAEAKPTKKSGKSKSDPGDSKSELAKSVGGLLGSLGVNVGSKLDTAAKAAGKSEDELAAEETRARPGDRGPHPRCAPVVERRRCAATRQPRRALGRFADESSRAAVDLRRDRHARGQCIRGAGRFHPRHARAVPAAGVGQRARGRAGARDQPLRAARSLQRDPQAGNGGHGQGRGDEERHRRQRELSPAATPGAMPRRTARPS